jgi:SAM-dependent methyltransferase
MHQNSIDHMRALVERYLDPAAKIAIGDIGSFNYNGSYRDLFRQPQWSYCGVDLDAGPNVDVVLTSPYKFPFDDAHFDVIVSGQAFEHVKFFWLTWMEMVRTLKPGGLIFLIAPSRGPEHRYPVDCWRFYPDGYRALAEYAGIECLEARTDWAAYPFAKGRVWGDTVGVFAKAPYRLNARAKEWLDKHGEPARRSFADRAASEITATVEGTLRSVKRRVWG